jgi:putative NIF3 family GTP cyclohydrolase 1 type 2
VISLAVLRYVEEPARRIVRRRLGAALAPRDRALISAHVPADA